MIRALSSAAARWCQHAEIALSVLTMVELTPSCTEGVTFCRRSRSSVGQRDEVVGDDLRSGGEDVRGLHLAPCNAVMVIGPDSSSGWKDLKVSP